MPDRDCGGSLADDNIRLFESSNFADATIVCCGRKWKVHKCILTSRSRWFTAAFCAEFIEAHNSTVELKEQDPDMVEMMLRFIYTKDLDFTKLKDGIDIPTLCVKLFGVGEYFLLHDLKHKTTTKLKEYLHKTPTDGPVDLPELPVHEKEHMWISDVLNALEEAYNARTTEPILDSMLSFVALNSRAVFRSNAQITWLHRIPKMGVHIIEKQTSGGMVTSSPKTRVKFGLPVLEAIDRDHRYKSEQATESLVGGSPATPCQLYPMVNNYPFIFKVMGLETERQIDSLSWMVPPGREVKGIIGYPDSTVVRVEKYEGSDEDRGIDDVLWLRFESANDARLYINRFRKSGAQLASEDWICQNLQGEMENDIIAKHARDSTFLSEEDE